MKEFKVICINDKGWIGAVLENGVRMIRAVSGPKLNEICTVVGDVIDPAEGYPAYILKEWSKHNLHGYAKREFLPLDDFKEVTFTELKKEMPVSAQ